MPTLIALFLAQINFEEVEMKTAPVNLDEIAQASMHYFVNFQIYL